MLVHRVDEHRDVLRFDVRRDAVAEIEHVARVRSERDKHLARFGTDRVRRGVPREMPAELVLSGHGEPITDHVGLIDSRFAAIDRRKEKIFKLIEERPRSGYELAQAIWGNVAVTQAFLTLSEVIGNTDLLVNEGRVREVDDGSVVRYEVSG